MNNGVRQCKCASQICFVLRLIIPGTASQPTPAHTILCSSAPRNVQNPRGPPGGGRSCALQAREEQPLGENAVKGTILSPAEHLATCMGEKHLTEVRVAGPRCPLSAVQEENPDSSAHGTGLMFYLSIQLPPTNMPVVNADFLSIYLQGHHYILCQLEREVSSGQTQGSRHSTWQSE